MQTTFTIGDLVEAGIISDAELRDASAAYMTRRTGRPFTFDCGHRVDLAAAVQGSPETVRALADDDTMIGEREIIVRDAIRRSQPL